MSGSSTKELAAEERERVDLLSTEFEHVGTRPVGAPVVGRASHRSSR
jgi:hypothetical protein